MRSANLDRAEVWSENWGLAACVACRLVERYLVRDHASWPQGSIFRFVEVALIPVVPTLAFSVVPATIARPRIGILQIKLWRNKMGCLQQMLSFKEAFLCPEIMTCERSKCDNSKSALSLRRSESRCLDTLSPYLRSGITTWLLQLLTLERFIFNSLLACADSTSLGTSKSATGGLF